MKLLVTFIIVMFAATQTQAWSFEKKGKPSKVLNVVLIDVLTNLTKGIEE